MYGLTDEAQLGITYTNAYHPTYLGAAWDDAFFGHLGSIATPKPLTVFQEDYNAQAGVLDVADDHWIDAAAVPKLVEADARLHLAQMAFVTHDYLGALSYARSGYEAVVAAASAAGVPVDVTEPSTWTILGPVKNGNGPGRKPVRKSAGARDLDEKANVKRMSSP